MRSHPIAVSLLLAASVVGCDGKNASAPQGASGSAIEWTHDALIQPGEKHFAHLRMLTKGGENAEAYWSFDDQRLSFQSTSDGFSCDQIFVMNRDGSGKRLVSTGKGVTTCAYFLPGDERVLFASTHLGGDACPPKPDRSKGYTWAIYPSYDIFTAKVDGTDLKLLTGAPGYDAEATVSPDGKRIVFTSVRDGDLELYTMNIDGSDVTRLTHEKGYDGGAFFSHDSKRICWRAHHPTEPEKIKDYEALLAEGLVRPTIMELWVMNVDGSDKRQLTSAGGANFCPYFTPDDTKLIFSSNRGDPKGREFDLYLIDIASKEIERVTTAEVFDGFPMFTRDGKYLVFGSNRGAATMGDTNIFLAEWKD
jgi:TolB protein